MSKVIPRSYTDDFKLEAITLGGALHGDVLPCMDGQAVVGFKVATDVVDVE
jgi:hypothetical protein